MKKSLFLIAALILAPLAIAAPKKPVPAANGAAIHYLESQGLTVDSRFSVPGGLHGYSATTPQGRHIVFYTTGDGKLAIFGVLLDAHGNNLSEKYQRAYIQKPLNRSAFKELSKVHWIKEGAKHPKRVIYAFVDPNCPYCHEFWQAARAAYPKGLQVRYIVVGILGNSSVNKAAAILGATDPGAAFEKNERGFKDHSGAIAPVKKMSDKLHSEIARHNRLMMQFGLDGTPGLVWKDKAGHVQTSNGLPQQGELAKILGDSVKQD